MPVSQAVFRQIVPAIGSQMIALIYNLADTYFVGKLNDPVQTASITVVYSSFVMLTAVSNLFGIGGASAMSQALGKHQKTIAQRISAAAVWGGLSAGILFSAVFYLFCRPALELCGATPEIYPTARAYAFWVIVAGGPGTILNTLLASLVRAEGKAAAASLGVSLGGILNILLDPLFILPGFLGMGAAGAGIATAVSNYMAALYFLILIRRNAGRGVVTILPVRPEDFRKYLKTVCTIGFPSAVQYALTVVAIAAQSAFVSRYATEAMAALGIVKKLDQLPLYFSIGVSNGLLPLLAYLHGAGKTARRRKVFRLGCLISLAFAVTCLILFELLAPLLASWFIDDPVTVRYSAAFLRRMVTAMPLMAVCYPMIIQFQAMGCFRESLICSVLRKGVLDIPLLFLMDRMLGVYGCMWVQPMVDGISLLAALYFFSKRNRKEDLSAFPTSG